MSVLSAVVLSHIEESQPVSSMSLARNRLAELSLSSATIRTVLADLEDEGFLEKPHHSAGRIPTEKGYRLFVKELMIARPPTGEEKMKIDSLVNMQERIEGTASNAVKLLTSLSHQAGILFLPDISESAIGKFYFIRISENRVQAVLVTVNDHIHNVILDVEEAWSEPTLVELANYLNANHSGQTLRKIRDTLKQTIANDERKVEILEARALALQEKLIERLPEPELNIEGTINLLDMPEFENNLDRLRAVLRAVSDRKMMLELIEKCISGKKISVNIGSDLAPKGFDGCSIIASTFGQAGGRNGVIGIVGPTRMDYPYLIGLVEYMSEAIKTGS